MQWLGAMQSGIVMAGDVFKFIATTSKKFSLNIVLIKIMLFEQP